MGGETLLLTRHGYRCAGEIPLGSSLWDGAEWRVLCSLPEEDHSGMVRLVLDNGLGVRCGESQTLSVRGVTEQGRATTQLTAASALVPGAMLSAWSLPIVSEVSEAEALPLAYVQGCWAVGDVWLGRLPAGIVLQRDKSFVPSGHDVATRLRWLEGVLDTNARVSRPRGNMEVRLVDDRPQFLRDVQLLLSTLGVLSSVGTVESGVETPAAAGENSSRYLTLGAFEIRVLRGLGLGCRRLWLNDLPTSISSSITAKAVRVAQVAREVGTGCVVLHGVQACVANGVLLTSSDPPPEG